MKKACIYISFIFLAACSSTKYKFNYFEPPEHYKGSKTGFTIVEEYVPGDSDPYYLIPGRVKKDSTFLRGSYLKLRYCDLPLYISWERKKIRLIYSCIEENKLDTSIVDVSEHTRDEDLMPEDKSRMRKEFDVFFLPEIFSGKYLQLRKGRQ